jgi:hypothetical protein
MGTKIHGVAGQKTSLTLLWEHAEQALIIREQIEDPNAAKVRAQLSEWWEQANT